jgi:hypothetical protein
LLGKARLDTRLKRGISRSEIAQRANPRLGRSRLSSLFRLVLPRGFRNLPHRLDKSPCPRRIQDGGQQTRIATRPASSWHRAAVCAQPRNGGVEHVGQHRRIPFCRIHSDRPCRQYAPAPEQVSIKLLARSSTPSCVRRFRTEPRLAPATGITAFNSRAARSLGSSALFLP